MGPSDNFDSVIEAAKHGDTEQFGKLYDLYSSALLTYLRARAPQDAEDLASDTWLAIAEHIHEFQGNDIDLRRWMFTIARNKAVDLFRSARKTRSTSIDPSDLIDIPSNIDTAESAIDDMYAKELVHLLIADLPSDQAEVVLLGAVGGFRATEIAKILGKKPGSVRMIQHRAVSKMSKRLGSFRPGQ